MDYNRLRNARVDELSRENRAAYIANQLEGLRKEGRQLRTLNGIMLDPQKRESVQQIVTALHSNEERNSSQLSYYHQLAQQSQEVKVAVEKLVQDEQRLLQTRKAASKTALKNQARARPGCPAAPRPRHLIVCITWHTRDRRCTLPTLNVRNNTRRTSPKCCM